MTDEPSLPVYWDEAFLAHEPLGGSHPGGSSDLIAEDEPHPDRPGRMRNIRRVVERALPGCASREPVEPATDDQLERVHDPAYLEELEALSAGGGARLTPHTSVNEATYEAAIRAAGASLGAAERALESGIEEVPYAMVRPSGHHAQPARADGYCYINNAAVAADHALAQRDVDRVAVVDWDVHHGNGTQECFYDRDDVLVVSLHNDHRSWGEWHPQTGVPAENGTGAGEGYTVNVPLPPGTGDEGYAYAFDRVVGPALDAFDPDLVIASAGQDPELMDPLGNNTVTKSGFREMGRRVRRVAEERADGALCVIQEGGYHIAHLAYTTLGVLEGVLDVETGIDDPYAGSERESLNEAVDWIHAAGRVAAEAWPVPFEAGPGGPDG